MTVMTLQNYALGRWVTGLGAATPIRSAITGEQVASASSAGLDIKAILDFARSTGGPALRAMTLHERAMMVKGLAQAIMAQKDALYALNMHSGATAKDGWIDIEGGAGTLFSLSSKARRELPDGHVIPDGPMEPLSKSGSFVGQHVYTPMQGVAVQINAFNFPVWGMLEKLGPALIAGVPAVVKPATATAYLAEAALRIMLTWGQLPEGAVQMICGPVGDLLDHLTGQDIISFTGSAATAAKLRSHPVVIAQNVRFIAEQDSLNACVLGPDADAESPEFALFIKEVVREMTVKAGQKCTAIRRAFVPASMMDAAQAALSEALAKITVGHPAHADVRMGALVSAAQRADVAAKVAQLQSEAQIVFGDPATRPTIESGAPDAFIGPVLLRCDSPIAASAVHETEAFGPVATLMPYQNVSEAIALCNRSGGSLVMSVFTHDVAVATAFVAGSAAFHGRMLLVSRDNAKESTGHGSPLPVLVHGGPGRAGGGEELGGVRAIKHYMQRTALQGSPTMLATITGQYLDGAEQQAADVHPFRKRLGELDIGYTLKTASRTITLDDIEHFARFTGDTFYAHMDEVAAAASPIFGGRVAHGYLILSFAAGLFVDPDPGPVLANYGLEGLRFVKPVKPGDAIQVALTVKSKAQRNPEMGEVKWAVRVSNQEDELVATYDLLTMNAV